MGALNLRRWLVLLATLLAAAGTARLGIWQLDRAAQKIALHEAMLARGALPPLDRAQLPHTADEARVQQHRRVVLQGRWVASRSIYLDNRQMNGQPGFFVVTPLQLADGDVVLVQRGWIPRNIQSREQMAAFDTPGGMVDIEGRIAPSVPRLYEFDATASGPIRQNLDIADFARETGLALRPLLVVQLDASVPAGDGLRRQWAPTVPDVSTHYGYAVQWFALSALITGLYVWFELLRPRRRRSR